MNKQKTTFAEVLENILELQYLPFIVFVLFLILTLTGLFISAREQELKHQIDVLKIQAETRTLDN